MLTRQEAIEHLQSGKIIAGPSDTIWGLFACADRPASVERIYELKKRNPAKPLIILLDSAERLFDFGISVTDQQAEYLDSVWPGPVSVILDVPEERQEELGYLHRGANSLAFRVPEPLWLREILAKTGPLVAPSANPEGEAPATNPEEVMRYFGSDIRVFVSPEYTLAEGVTASQVVRFSGDGVEVFRN